MDGPHQGLKIKNLYKVHKVDGPHQGLKIYTVHKVDRPHQGLKTYTKSTKWTDPTKG